MNSSFITSRPDIAISEARKSQHTELQGQCFFYYFSYFIRFGLEVIAMTSMRHWCILVAF